MTVRIRRATPEDAADLAAVHLASWRVAYRDDAPPGWLDGHTVETETESWGTRLTAVPAPLVLLAHEPGGVVIGFSGLLVPSRDSEADAFGGDDPGSDPDPVTVLAPDTGEIATFYVDPAHWRRGAGRALMTAALAELAAAGCTAATLWVLETNARAQRFYAALGFAADGARQRTGPGWPPEIRMRRPLD